MTKVRAMIVVLDQTNEWCTRLAGMAGAISKVFIYDAESRSNLLGTNREYELYPIGTFPAKDDEFSTIFRALQAHDDFGKRKIDARLVDQLSEVENFCFSSVELTSECQRYATFSGIREHARKTFLEGQGSVENSAEARLDTIRERVNCLA